MTPVAMLFAGLLGAGMAVIIWYDIRQFRIPDGLSLPFIGLGFLATWALGQSLTFSVAGAIAGYWIFRALEWGFRKARGYDGLGRGDAKLAAVAGAWVGVFLLPQVILVASLSGILFVLVQQRFLDRNVSKYEHLPFAPFLGGAIFAVFVLHMVVT